MFENKNVFVPPAVLPISPYTKGNVVKMDAEDKYIMTKPFVENFEVPNEASSPYKTAVAWQKETGVRCISLMPEKSSEQTKLNNKGLAGIDENQFLEDAEGLYCKIQGKVVKICNFHLRISKITVYKRYYGGERRFINFEVIAPNNAVIKVDMPIAEYKRMMSKLTSDYPQLSVNPRFGNAASYFSEYASNKYASALDRLKTEVIYDYHGWAKIGAKMVYLSKSLSYCNAECYLPQISRDKMSQVYVTGQSFLDVGKKVYQNGQIDSIATLKQILPIFLYAHAGYTAKLFKDAGCDLQFVLAIIGKTGSFKTSISKVIFETFNTKPMLNFQSTPRAIELYRDACRDMTLILDDIFSCRDKETMAKFENVLRCFGDNIAKAKSDITTNKIEQFDVRGACVITAENELARQQSSMLRYITVHVDKNSFSSEELKKWQTDAINSKRNGVASKLQEYFALYIQYLEEHYNTILRTIMDFEAPKLKLDFARLQSNYKCLAILARLVLNFGINSLALTINEAEEIYEQWISVLQDIILTNHRDSKVCSPFELFAYALNQGIGTGMITIAGEKCQYAEDVGKLYIGYRESKDDTYVLNPEKAYQFVENFYNKKGASFQSSDTAVYRDLYDHGIISGYVEKYTKSNGTESVRVRYLKKVTIQNVSTSMLVINKTAFDELIKNME